MTKAQLVDYAGARRFAIETGGVLLGGIPVDTSRESQNMIANAVSFLKDDPEIASVEFKTPAGFVTLAREVVLEMGRTIGRHVQACFAAERAVLAGVESGTVRTPVEVDGAFEQALTGA
jgi:Domain of unknown function (DUF4376)